jgi:voltage-gated potassium channel
MRQPVRVRSPWGRLKWAGVALLGVLSYGIAGYWLLFGWSFTESLYMTVMTLTTVGYREVRPLDGAGQLFTTTLIVFGVSLLLTTLSLAAGTISQRDFGDRSRRRRMQRRIDAMRNHYIVCAYGRVGRAVARQFEEEGVPYVVVDRDEELEARMIDDGVVYLVADPTFEETLVAAGIDRARALVTAVDSDAENVYITLTARALNEGIFIVARASKSETIDRLHRAGADRVVSPYRHSGRQMAVLASQPALSDYLEVVAGPHVTLRVDEVKVDPDSPLIGRTIGSSLAGKMPLALRRVTGELFCPPRADELVQKGDLILSLREMEAWHERPVDDPR